MTTAARNRRVAPQPDAARVTVQSAAEAAHSKGFGFYCARPRSSSAKATATIDHPKTSP